MSVQPSADGGVGIDDKIDIFKLNNEDSSTISKVLQERTKARGPQRSANLVDCGCHGSSSEGSLVDEALLEELKATSIKDTSTSKSSMEADDSMKEVGKSVNYKDCEKIYEFEKDKYSDLDELLEQIKSDKYNKTDQSSQSKNKSEMVPKVERIEIESHSRNAEGFQTDEPEQIGFPPSETRSPSGRSSLSEDRSGADRPLLTLKETTLVREAWDFLVGHVGITTLGGVFMRRFLRRDQDLQKTRNDMSETAEEILFPKPITKMSEEAEAARLKADSLERGIDLAILINKRVLQACDLYRDKPWILPVRLTVKSDWGHEVKTALAGRDFKKIPLCDIPEKFVKEAIEVILETIVQGLESNGKMTDARQEALQKFMQHPWKA